jgi:NAD kinase
MEKIIVIHRPTRLDSLVARFNTRQQAKFYIEHLRGDFSDYENEHEKYYRSLEELERIAMKIGKVHQVEWKYLPNFLFGAEDLVVAVGQDGTVANTLKYLNEQRIIGINPDNSRWDGILAQFSVNEADLAIKRTFENKTPIMKVTKAKVELADGQLLYAVNDFFIGIRSHSSARYTLSVDGKKEPQSSSGVIVSTPLGRSGWMRSILAGATGITSQLAGKSMVIKEQNHGDWGKNRLTFAVREPFPSVSSGTDLLFGTIGPETDFQIESRMGENGIIFSDGIQDDFLEFNYSIVAKISIAETKGNIVVNASNQDA